MEEPRELTQAEFAAVTNQISGQLAADAAKNYVLRTVLAGAAGVGLNVAVRGAIVMIARAGIPAKALRVLQYVRANGRPPQGHVGGRVFRNREGRLPGGGRYREYDVDPRPTQGGSRNAERIVVDENTGQAWYTNDHYQTFTEIP